MSATIAALRELQIFKGLTERELDLVAEICETKRYEPGEFIFHEGEPGNRLFIVVGGEVRISRQIPGAGEEALAVLMPGALFGEMAVFDRSERSTDAISHGGTDLVTISRAEFEECYWIFTVTSRTRCCGPSCGCSVRVCGPPTTRCARCWRCRCSDLAMARRRYRNVAGAWDAHTPAEGT